MTGRESERGQDASAASRNTDLAAAPATAMTRQESSHAIDSAAAARGIKSVRDAGDLRRDVKGEVVAVSSRHALVAISNDVAVRFEKAGLDRNVQPGDRVAIHYAPGKSQVYEQGREPAPGARDMARELVR